MTEADKDFIAKTIGVEKLHSFAMGHDYYNFKPFFQPYCFAWCPDQYLDHCQPILEWLFRDENNGIRLEWIAALLLEIPTEKRTRLGRVCAALATSPAERVQAFLKVIKTNGDA